MTAKANKTIPIVPLIVSEYKRKPIKAAIVIRMILSFDPTFDFIVFVFCFLKVGSFSSRKNDPAHIC